MKNMLEGIRQGKRLIKQRMLPIALVSLALGLVFDWLFYGKLPGISVFIYTALILGCTFYLAEQFKYTLNKSIYWLAPVTIFFSLMVFVRANAFLMFINILLVIYLLMVVAQLARKPKVQLQQYDILDYFNLIASTPVMILREFFQFLLRVLSNRNNTVPKSSVTPIVRGVLISLPVLVIFLLLLSSADLVFKEYVTSVFRPEISPETVFRWGLIGFVTSLFIGAYALIFMPSGSSEMNSATKAVRKQFELGTTEASIILGSVIFLFFVFVLVQLTYLFGGSDHISSIGYTYAEYARKGFFELVAVAAISLILILTIKKVAKYRTITETFVFKWLGGVLIAEVMIIMASAHMRLDLYEAAYGFTTLRLWSHLFILWLVASFVLLSIHIVRGKSEKKFAFQLFISVLCFFAVINIINPDAFIARQNIKRFNDVGKLDVNYLSSLSEDATPTIASSLKSPNKDLRKSAASILYAQKESTLHWKAHWQSANLAKKRADQIFRDNAGQIEDAKSYGGDYMELNVR